MKPDSIKRPEIRLPKIPQHCTNNSHPIASSLATIVWARESINAVLNAALPRRRTSRSPRNRAPPRLCPSRAYPCEFQLPMPSSTASPNSRTIDRLHLNAPPYPLPELASNPNEAKIRRRNRSRFEKWVLKLQRRGTSEWGQRPFFLERSYFVLNQVISFPERRKYLPCLII